MCKLFTVLILIGVLTGCGDLHLEAYVPALEMSTFVSAATSKPATQVAAPALTPTAEDTGADYKVCTGIPAGRLHVRFEAGEKSAVRGYIVEAEIVTSTGQSKEMPDGSLWMQLQNPIAGWVNAKYLCSQ